MANLILNKRHVLRTGLLALSALLLCAVLLFHWLAPQQMVTLDAIRQTLGLIKIVEPNVVELRPSVVATERVQPSVREEREHLIDDSMTLVALYKQEKLLSKQIMAYNTSLKKLVTEYEQDINDPSRRRNIKAAILNSDDYRDALKKKHKVDRAIALRLQEKLAKNEVDLKGDL